ncbi:regulator of MON1-CCZ1 complex [Leucoraja erinacea]|uniref:regulator of MON1-CCZ1 complex n=1 Tax=Leucoraja erinaceus TaxID=7782 RepID=UPI0024584671|nr:regulator of MON1-CCZ1 complex [Leucoraja erinacea]
MAHGHHLALCRSPVTFEKVSALNSVFFDETNKQVFAVRSGGATGVVAKGLDDKASISFRMEDKGEVKCIKFSFGNKILAVQRTPKAVDFINFIPDLPQTEYSQECKTKNANILGFCWTSTSEIVFITDQGIEFYQVLPDKRALKQLKTHSINVNWYMYCPETAVLLLSTTVQGNVLQPFTFRSGTMTKMPKFEIELPTSPKSGNPILSDRDTIMAIVYGQLYVLYLKHQPRAPNNPGAEVILYYLPREGQCKKMHILKLNTIGKFALNVVDNLVVVHHQSSQTSMIFDIKLRAEFDGAVTIHQQVLLPLSIQPCKIPRAGPAAVTTQSPIPCELYSSSWSVFQPDIIINASEGYLWCLQITLQPIVHMLHDRGRLMDFLLQRKDCKMVILSVCSDMLSATERASLPVIATVFDKLNQVYKEYLEADQNYILVSDVAGTLFDRLKKGSDPKHCLSILSTDAAWSAEVLSHFVFCSIPAPAVPCLDYLAQFHKTHSRRQCVQIVMLGLLLQDLPHKFISAVLMEYIRSLNQFQIPVQHYLYELVIKTLVQHSMFYMLHQFLQYHVLSDSKPLACLLLSLESTYPPAHQLSLDMLKRLSTANDEIVEVLLSKHQVLGALRFIRSVGSHDNISARKFLDAAKQTGDTLLFYTTFRFFEQRNQRLRGSSHFTPGEHCEEHVVHFKSLFGEEALLTALAV